MFLILTALEAVCNPNEELISIPEMELDFRCQTMIQDIYARLQCGEKLFEKQKFMLAQELSGYTEYCFDSIIVDTKKCFSTDSEFFPEYSDSSNWFIYDWNGMECQTVNIIGDAIPELFILLRWSGTARSVSVYVFKIRDDAIKGYELTGFERGLMNISFIFNVANPNMHLFNILNPTSEIKYLYDLNGDERMEIILHSLKLGFLERFALSGDLYWPYIIMGTDSGLVDASDLFPEYYSEELIPLYKLILEDLQREYEEQGGEGTHPTIELIRKYEELFRKKQSKI